MSSGHDGGAVAPVPNEIGERVRSVRRRRGLSQETVAGLAGVSGPYLSMIERGRRRVDSRGLLSRLADALGCSVLDLTGEPFVPSSQTSADAMLTVPAVQLALADTSLSDVPDEPVRPLDRLVPLVEAAHAEYLDRARYDRSGAGLGALLVELHIHVVTGPEAERARASRALVQALMVAFGLTKNLGHPDLALHAAARGWEVAEAADDPGPMAFAAQRRAQALQRVGADRRAGTVLGAALDDADRWADPTAADTTAAQGAGLLHLTSALGAARGRRRDDALAHLAAARELVERMGGEGNAFGQHVGPANLGVWAVTIGAELGEGAAALDGIERIDLGALASADRVAMLHTDAARALAQEGGRRDADAVRHLDLADRAGAARIRQDPIARELVATLAGRAPRPSWELRSLRNRFGAPISTP